MNDQNLYFSNLKKKTLSKHIEVSVSSSMVNTKILNKSYNYVKFSGYLNHIKM